jgi:hypothetical protein
LGKFFWKIIRLSFPTRIKQHIKISDWDFEGGPNNKDFENNLDRIETKKSGRKTPEISLGIPKWKIDAQSEEAPGPDTPSVNPLLTEMREFVPTSSRFNEEHDKSKG